MSIFNLCRDFPRAYRIVNLKKTGYHVIIQNTYDITYLILNPGRNIVTLDKLDVSFAYPLELLFLMDVPRLGGTVVVKLLLVREAGETLSS